MNLMHFNDTIKDFINQEMEIISIISNNRFIHPTLKKQWIALTKQAISNYKSILNPMAQAHVYCVFKARSRHFKITHIGAKEGKDCYVISEVEKVKEGDRDVWRIIGDPQKRTISEINKLVSDGVIEVVESFNHFNR